MLLIAGSLLGGVGLFILAVSMITSGLKLAAGETLQDLLGRYTSTPLRGLASGMLVTGLVRSSSAVTVATIGFVNAGLLTLPQSLGVVYGANLGTTTTAWLVAAVGLDFRIETLALPLIGLGMLSRLIGRDSRLGGIGEAVAGFGLFFIGIDVLRQAFAGFSGAVDVTAYAPDGILGIALYVGVGFLMTVVTQSSSAAIAVILSAASGGALTLEAAAATVIGANLGTTSTAALAVIGATANARRVAAAHVVFNGVTGVVALLLLPVLIWAAGVGADLLGIHAPAAELALFHTVFNTLGVLLMWPFTTRLAEFLATRFVTQAEMMGRPQHLDRSVRVTPELAVQALQRELGRAAALAADAAAVAVSLLQTGGAVGHGSGIGHGSGPGVDGGGVDQLARLEGLRALLKAIDAFVSALESSRLAPEIASDVPVLLRVSNYLEDVAGLAADLDGHRRDVTAISLEPVSGAVLEFRSAVLAQLELCRDTIPAAASERHDPLHPPAPQRLEAGGGVSPSWQRLQDGLADLEYRWHELKSTLLQAGAHGQLPLGRLNRALDGLRGALKMAEQQSKAVSRLVALQSAADGDDAEPVARPLVSGT